MLALTPCSLAACGNRSSKKASQENSSLKAENSSLKAQKKAQKKSQSSSSSTNAASSNTGNQTSQSASSAIIKTPQDAAALVTHAMSVNPGIYHATPTNGGFIVSRDDMPDQSAFVHYDGSITWSNNETQSYDSASATTYNGGASTFHPAN